MTVKEVKVALAKCSTVEEVNALDLKTDDRKGVIDALAEKIHELTDESVIADKEEAEATPAPAPEATPAPEAKKVKEATPEEKKIALFRSKVPYTCRMDNVASGAEEFFGKDFKSSEINRETGMVKITLKSKTKFEVRGV